MGSAHHSEAGVRSRKLDKPPTRFTVVGAGLAELDPALASEFSWALLSDMALGAPMEEEEEEMWSRLELGEGVTAAWLFGMYKGCPGKANKRLGRRLTGVASSPTIWHDFHRWR